MCKEHWRLAGKLHVPVDGVADLVRYRPDSTLNTHQGLDLGFLSPTAKDVRLHTQPPTLCISAALHVLFISPFHLQKKVMSPVPLLSDGFAMAPNCLGEMHFLESPWALIPAFHLNLSGLKSGSSDYSNFWSFSVCDLQICPS